MERRPCAGGVVPSFATSARAPQQVEMIWPSGPGVFITILARDRDEEVTWNVPPDPAGDLVSMRLVRPAVNDVSARSDFVVILE